MAEEVDYLKTFFLHSIPSLFRQYQENLHSDNLNVLEYFERRLDDHAYVVRSVIIQCEQQRANKDLIQFITSPLIIGEISVSSIYRQNYLAAKHSEMFMPSLYRQNYFAAALRRDNTDKIISPIIIGEIFMPS